MSELYAVAVESVAGNQVTLRVRTVHPDAGPPPKAPTFPMNLLVDLWWLLERGYSSLIQGVDLEEQQGIDLAHDAMWSATMQRLKDLSHGVEAPITEAEYEALGRGEGLPARFGGQRAGAWAMNNGRYYVVLDGDEAAFGAACAEVVTGYEQDELKNQDAYDAWPDWPEPATEKALAAYREREPSARLVLTVKEPALLGFVRAGMSFDTAAYF